jgi:hypothetical protein
MRFRAPFAAFLLVLAIVPSLWLVLRYSDFPQFGIFNDDSVYYANAQSLAEGQGYRVPSHPGSPFQAKYPPLFPLYLSIAWKLQPSFPANLGIALKLEWLLIPAFMALSWLMLRDFEMGLVEAGALCLWIGVSPIFNLMSLSLLCELFASVFILASILAMERAAKNGSMRWSAAAGVLAAACCLTKSGALPILVSAPVGFWLVRRKRLIAPFLAVALPLAGAWQIWVATHKNPSSEEYVGSYLTYLGQMHLASVFLVNFDQILTGIAGFLFYIFSEQWWWQLVGWIVCIAGMSGVVRLMKRTGRWQFAVFAVGYAGLMVIWNGVVGTRMTLELLPLAAAGIYTEAKHLVSMCAANLQRPKIADRCAALVMLSLVGAFVGYSGTLIYGGLTSYAPSVMASQRIWWKASALVFDWIRENTPADARFYANNETMLYLRTGRRGFSMPLTPPLRYETPANKAAYLKHLPEVIRRNEGTYALLLLGDVSPDLGDNGRNVALSALEKDPEFRPVFRYSEAVVFEVHPGRALPAAR